MLFLVLAEIYPGKVQHEFQFMKRNSGKGIVQVIFGILFLTATLNLQIIVAFIMITIGFVSILIDFIKNAKNKS